MWAYGPVKPKLVITVSRYPVTYFVGGIGTEHLAVQMDEKHIGQKKLITAHFPSI